MNMSRLISTYLTDSGVSQYQSGSKQTTSYHLFVMYCYLSPGDSRLLLGVPLQYSSRGPTAKETKAKGDVRAREEKRLVNLTAGFRQARTGP